MPLFCRETLIYNIFARLDKYFGIFVYLRKEPKPHFLGACLVRSSFLATKAFPPSFHAGLAIFSQLLHGEVKCLNMQPCRQIEHGGSLTTHCRVNLAAFLAEMTCGRC